MTITTRLATVAATVGFSLFGAPLSHADNMEPYTTCSEWSNFTKCRTTAYDIASGEGYTIDCIFYEDGTSKCT